MKKKYIRILRGRNLSIQKLSNIVAGSPRNSFFNGEWRTFNVLVDRSVFSAVKHEDVPVTRDTFL